VTIHSVFDSAAGNPATVLRADDGDPSIILGNGFYIFAAAADWYCTGGKVYVPDITNVTSITVSAYQANPPVSPDLGAVPDRTASVVSPQVGWNLVEWDEPLLMENVSVSGQGTYIVYTCVGAPDTYFAGSGLSVDAIVAFDGSDVAMAEGSFPRSYFKVGADATAGSNTYYGVDIIISTELPDPGGDMGPILVGSGSLHDQIMAGLESQGFSIGSISDRERARLLAKLVLIEPQPLSLYDLYDRADEPYRIR